MAFTIWIFVGFNVYGIKYPKKPFYTYGCPVFNSTAPYNTTSSYYSDTSYMDTTTTVSSMIQPRATVERSGLEAFHAVSYTWYGFCAVFITMTVGTIVSLITGRTKPGEVDTDLMIPLLSKIFQCFPKSFRTLLECGYPYRVTSHLNLVYWLFV